jgi:UDP-N-acetylglucosamine 2-epimerase (non-hydrolysing)
MTLQKVAFITGTRPEIIKLAPVCHALNKRRIRVAWCHSGQHDVLAEQAFSQFNIVPDVELVRPPEESLAALTAGLIVSLDQFLQSGGFQAVCVQGDTSTTLAGALSAFYARVPVFHVEAGLRSGDMDHPFPEESNRRLVSHIAVKHYAPTGRAVAALRAENVPDSSIVLTGNTVVDALHHLVGKGKSSAKVGPVLVTAHRRENWQHLPEICDAVLALSTQHLGLEFLFVMHANPELQAVVTGRIGDHPKVKLSPPLDYFELQSLLASAPLVLTDSGGIQEEAPTYDVPVVVLRKKTERPEVVEAGIACLAGAEHADTIIKAANKMLLVGKDMRHTKNPFGDGRAAEYIADDMLLELNAMTSTS